MIHSQYQQNRLRKAGIFPLRDCYQGEELKQVRRRRYPAHLELSKWRESFIEDLGSRFEDRHNQKFDEAYFDSIQQQLEQGDQCADNYALIAKDYATRQANLWLLNYEQLKRSDISFTDSDHDFKDWADAKAVRCQELVRRYRIGEAWRLCSELAEEYEIPRLWVKGREGVCFLKELPPLMERYKDAAWWLRQIRKTALREVEKVALSLGEIHKKNQAYCSNYVVKKRNEQKVRNQNLLENLKAVNNEGDEYSLQELSDLGVSNPTLRRHELMCRLSGFEGVARCYGHASLFATITCPSRYHPSSKKYGGFTPREAQSYLSGVWARIRSQLNRKGIYVYGFRIAEPHKDACPHWHVLLFHGQGDGDVIQSIIRTHALVVDGKEAGAKKNRVDFETIDLEKGSAVGYIAKYICKNIDGVFKSEFMGEEMEMAFNAVDIDGNFIGRSDDAARRVEAWASTWGIRQFQQIGGPSVTVWRELRRMDTEEDEFDLFGGVVERARKAADSGDWAAFCIVMGGVCTPRKEHALKALMFVPHEIDKSTGELIVSAFDVTNKYGEPSKGCVLGVTALGIDYLTRYFEWDIQSTRTLEIVDTAGSRELVPDWVLRGAAPPSEAQLNALDLCK